MYRRIHLLSLLFVACLCLTAHAQSGLRESLERLDINENGEIDPDEITSLARPYLERIASAKRLRLERSNRIEEFQEAARIYHALQNGVRGERVRVKSESSVKSFEPDDEQNLIPDFGAAVIKYPYNQEDIEEADRTIRRYDRDDDGFIDRREANRATWTHRDPFEMDLNKDDRMSRVELAQRYARRRLLEGDAGELIQKARRVGNGIQPTTRREESGREDRSRWWREGNSYWLTASLMSRFDADRNGRLSPEESATLGMPVGQIDADLNGEISREEMYGYLKELQDESSDSDGPLPGWFYELDEDRDGQVSVREFAEELTDAKLLEFASFDANSDGLLTSMEVASSAAIMGGSYRNDSAEILPPKKTVISEIEVPEDIIVGDLNLQLTITHTSTAQLEGYLTGPDGQRIELFNGIGGSGDNFEKTTFDDQASTPITKGRSPFEGSYLPAAAIRRQPSLSHFNGKSAKGVWQLVIRCTRSDRFGMLHNWALLIRPDDRQTDLLSNEYVGLAADAARQQSAAPPPQEPDSEPQRGYTSKMERTPEQERADYDALKRRDYGSIDWKNLNEEKVAEYKEFAREQESRLRSKGGDKEKDKEAKLEEKRQRRELKSTNRGD